MTRANLEVNIRRHIIKLLPLFVALAVFAVSCTLGGPSSATPTATVVPTPTPTPVPPTQRAIIIQGACSSSSTDGLSDHWVNIVKSILTVDYGLTDLPTGNPDDEVIEFGYSPDGWDRDYEPGNTLQSVGTSSAGLRDIYAAYPNSEFFIIGHSLGGVVALDGLARYSTAGNGMISSTGGVITVSSPVRGLRDITVGTAGAAIELIACRRVPVLDGSSEVWGDMARSGDSITLIQAFDWTTVRAVNFGNEKDLVVDVETATLPDLFEVSCYNAGKEGFLELNHDTLLGQKALAEELLEVLMDGTEPKQNC